MMRMMMTPFDFIKSISENKKDLMLDKLAEKEYNAFMVNRGLSFFPDTILYANEMNMNHHLDNKLQFSYLMTIIRPRKRFSKWAKKKTSDDLQAISEYYNCNMKKAEEYLRMLNADQLKSIKEALNRGGTK
jgi:hypothetical protein